MQSETNPMNYIDDPMSNNQIIPGSLLSPNNQQHINGPYISPQINNQFQHPQQIKQQSLVCYGKMPDMQPNFAGQNMMYNENMQKGYYYNAPYRNDQMGLVRYNPSNYYQQHMMSHPQQSQQMSLHCYNKQPIPPQHSFFQQRNMGFYPEANLNQHRFMNDQQSWNTSRGMYGGRMTKSSIDVVNFDVNFSKHGQDIDMYNYPVRYPGHIPQQHIPQQHLPQQHIPQQHVPQQHVPQQHIGNKYFMPQPQIPTEPLVDPRFYNNKQMMAHPNEMLKPQHMHFEDNYYTPGSQLATSSQQSSNIYLPGRRLEHFSHTENCQQPSMSQHQQMFSNISASSAFHMDGSKGQSSTKSTLEYHHSDPHSHPYDNLSDGNKSNNNVITTMAANQNAERFKFSPGPNNFQQSPDKTNVQSVGDEKPQILDQNKYAKSQIDGLNAEHYQTSTTSTTNHQQSSTPHQPQPNTTHCTTSFHTITTTTITKEMTSGLSKDNNFQHIKHSSSALFQQASKSICSTMKMSNQSRSNCSQLPNDNYNSTNNPVLNSSAKPCDTLNSTTTLMMTTKVKQPRKPRKKKSDSLASRPVGAISEHHHGDRRVVVPYKWKRVIENKSVYYISPSRVRLESLKEIYQYLLTDGTCKCGLLCPLFIEQVFVFDWLVESKHLTNEEACSKAINSNSLCYHKKKMKFKNEGMVGMDDRKKSLNSTFSNMSMSVDDNNNKYWRQQQQQQQSCNTFSFANNKHTKHKERRRSKLECSLIDTYKSSNEAYNLKHPIHNNINNNINTAGNNINEDEDEEDKLSNNNYNYMHSVSSSSSSVTLYNRKQLISSSLSQLPSSPYDSDATKSVTDISCSGNESCSSDDEDAMNRLNAVPFKNNTNQHHHFHHHHNHHHKHLQQPTLQTISFSHHNITNDGVITTCQQPFYKMTTKEQVPIMKQDLDDKLMLKSCHSDFEHMKEQPNNQIIKQPNVSNFRNTNEDVQSTRVKLEQSNVADQLQQTTCPIKLVENMVSELMTTKNSLAEVTTMMMMSKMESERKKKMNEGLERSKLTTSPLVTVENITSAKVGNNDNINCNISKIGSGVVLTSNIHISSSCNNISTSVATITSTSATLTSCMSTTFTTLPSMKSALTSALSFVGLKMTTTITTTSSLFSAGKLTAKTSSTSSFLPTTSNSYESFSKMRTTPTTSSVIMTTSFLTNNKYNNILTSGSKLSTLLNVEDLNKISTATTIDEMFSDDDEEEEDQVDMYNNTHEKDNVINIWLENNDKNNPIRENTEIKNESTNDDVSDVKDSDAVMDVDDVVKTTGTQTSTPASNSTLEFVDNDGDSRETICCGSVENTLNNVSTTFDGITTGASSNVSENNAKTPDNVSCSTANSVIKTSTTFATMLETTATKSPTSSTSISFTTSIISNAEVSKVSESFSSPAMTTTATTIETPSPNVININSTNPNINHTMESLVFQQNQLKQQRQQQQQQQVVVLPTQQSPATILIPHQQHCSNINFDSQLYQTAQANYLQSLGFGFAQGQVGLLHFATTPSTNQSLGLALGMGVNILNNNNNVSNNNSINFNNSNTLNMKNNASINEGIPNKVQLFENQKNPQVENNPILNDSSSTNHNNSTLSTTTALSTEPDLKPLTTTSVNANQLFQLVVSQGVQQAHHILVPNYSSFTPFAGAALVPVPVVQPNSMAFCNLVATPSGPPTLFTVGQNPFSFMTAGPILVSEEGGDKATSSKKLKSPMYCHDAPDSTVDSEEVGSGGGHNHANNTNNNNNSNNNNNNGSTNNNSDDNNNHINKNCKEDDKDDSKSSSSSSSSSSICVPTSSSTTAVSEKTKNKNAFEINHNNSNNNNVNNNNNNNNNKPLSSSPIIIGDDDDKQTTIMDYSTSSETDDNDDVMGMTNVNHHHKTSVEDSSSQASETFARPDDKSSDVRDGENMVKRKENEGNNDDDDDDGDDDGDGDHWNDKNQNRNKYQSKKLLKYAHSIKRKRNKNFTNLISNLNVKKSSTSSSSSSASSHRNVYAGDDGSISIKDNNKNDCKSISMPSSSSSSNINDKTSNDCLVTTSDASNNNNNNNNNDATSQYNDDNNSVMLSVSNMKRFQRKKHEMRMKMMRKMKPESPISSDDTIDDADSTTTTTLPTPSPCNFNIGDLVWGPTRGYPSWPGKLVSEIEVKGNPKPEYGKIWVKWFGDNTYAQADINQLKTLSEGLETHHNARKTHRKGRKMNAGLEAAIQEAMFELDRQMDKQTSQQNSNNNNNNGDNVAMTIVSKKSRR